MLTRRTLLALTAGACLLAALPLPAFAQDGSAVAFIEQNGNRILKLAPDAAADASARAQLLGVVNEALDVDGVARFALGPYVRQATPAQLQKYLALFHQVISNGVTARLSSYRGASFKVGRSDAQDGGTLVHSVIGRPGSPDANVDWLVGSTGSGMRILDVIAEGTSLRLTERSDYTSFLQNHGGNIDALLSALAAQTGQ